MTILLCCSSQAQAAQSGDYTYSVTDGNAQITRYTGVGGVVTTPSTLGGYPVTSIGATAFRGCTDLTSISISQGVTSIDGEASEHGFASYGAFQSCTGLTSISIPQGVTSIGASVFEGCTGLTSISIPQGVTSIDDCAFEGTGLTSFSIPQGTSIGTDVFAGCTGLTTVSIPQGVTSINISAFYDCTGLTSFSVAVGNSAYSTINGMLFNKAGTSLIACPGGLTSSISIPQGTTSIGNGAFYDCIGLTSINIPQGVTSIGDNAFWGTGLTSISIPQGVTSIGNNAFYFCTGLTSISIPQGVTSIGDAAFYYCTGLTSITFNSAAITIYDDASTIPSTTTIIGYDPSTAKTYATNYERNFESLNSVSGSSAPSLIIYQNTNGQYVSVNYLNALSNAPMKEALIIALTAAESANRPIFVITDTGRVINYIEAINKGETYMAAVNDSAVNQATASVATQQMNTDGSVTAVLCLPSVTLANATIGTVYTSNFSATGGTPPYSYALASGSSLPAGLTLETDGTISGTPTAIGTTIFTVNVTYSTMPTAETTSQAFSITVNPAAFSLSGATLNNGTVGILYTAILKATGGTPPYNYALASGSSLPAGLMLGSNGIISGIPTTSGTTIFTVNVTDSVTPIAGTASNTFSLTIYPDTSVKEPVINLYPTKEQQISVKLDFNGKFTHTYPDYKNGWEVIAHPDGTILNLDDNKNYPYLIWEGILDNNNWDMTKGFVIAGKDTKDFLQDKLSLMGLTPKECNDFIAYWLPMMQDNKYNLITFPNEDYSQRVNLTIEPKPDSVLRVLMVYKPLTEKIYIPTQQLTTFQRTGFSVVEWGGTEVK